MLKNIYLIKNFIASQKHLYFFPISFTSYRIASKKILWYLVSFARSFKFWSNCPTIRILSISLLVIWRLTVSLSIFFTIRFWFNLVSSDIIKQQKSLSLFSIINFEPNKVFWFPPVIFTLLILPFKFSDSF